MQQLTRTLRAWFGITRVEERTIIGLVGTDATCTMVSDLIKHADYAYFGKHSLFGPPGVGAIRKNTYLSQLVNSTHTDTVILGTERMELRHQNTPQMFWPFKATMLCKTITAVTDVSDEFKEFILEGYTVIKLTHLKHMRLIGTVARTHYVVLNNDLTYNLLISTAVNIKNPCASFQYPDLDVFAAFKHADRMIDIVAIMESNAASVGDDFDTIDAVVSLQLKGKHNG